LLCIFLFRSWLLGVLAASTLVRLFLFRSRQFIN
jgi:hypothetical protein